MPTPILTYHSQNVAGNDYVSNDHIALKQDLAALDDAGFVFAPLHQLVSSIRNHQELPEKRVVLTFDDGCDLDVLDIDWPPYGVQRGFLGILEDFARSRGVDSQPGLHATTFVIASEKARKVIDDKSLYGKGWLSHSWWERAEAHPMLSVGNHSWDHNHHDLRGPGRGSFHAVDDHPKCLVQVVGAAAAIEARSGTWPRFFAYPYGESGDYIREEFFPDHPEVHGCQAALGTDPEPVSVDSDIWNLPRFVYGRDWNSPQALIELL